MTVDFKLLLQNPKRFFSEITEKKNIWVLASLGYYLNSFTKGVGNIVAQSDVGDSVTSQRVIVQAAGGAVITAGFGVIFLGLLWVYLGSRLVKGTASLLVTVAAVGAALFWPGVAALFTIPFILTGFSPGQVAQGNLSGSYIMAIVFQGLLALWALYNVGKAVKVINNFTTKQALAVMLWVPGFLISLALLFSAAAQLF